MKLVFQYNPNREYDNFKRSFFSINHKEASPRQKEYFTKYTELDSENALAFSHNYILENHIDIESRQKDIEKQWNEVKKEYFRRADKVFKTTLPIKIINVYLTIHDRCSYNFAKSEFFIHLNLPTTNKTIMHELWHWYFYYTVGQRIEEKKGKKIFNDIKESLTVLLNDIYSDRLAGATDRGYPQHAGLRKLIQKTYAETNDVYQTIDRAIATL